MKLGFQFAPLPREIWTDEMDLSKAEFRLLGWFCCNLRFGVQQLEFSDDQVLNGGECSGQILPPLGLSRNAMHAARALLTKKNLIVARQKYGGGGRGKSALWVYSLNLSETSQSLTSIPETCQTLTINPSNSDRNSQLNLSNFDNAIKEEREVQETPESTLDRAWTYFIAKLKKNAKLYTLTEKRKKQGLSRISECLKKCDGDYKQAAMVIKNAIDALAESQWHRDNGFDDWEQIFRSAEKFEAMVARKGKGNGRAKQNGAIRNSSEIDYRSESPDAHVV